MKEDTLKDEESCLPGAFPELIEPIHSSDTNIISDQYSTHHPHQAELVVLPVCV